MGAAASASRPGSPTTSDVFCSAHRQYGEASYRTEGRWRDATVKGEGRTFGKRFSTTPACVPPPFPPLLAPTLPPSASSSRGRGDPPPPPLSPSALSLRPRQLSRSPVELDSRRPRRARPRQAPSEGGGGNIRGDSDAAGDAFPAEKPGGTWGEDSVGDGLERFEGHDGDDDDDDSDNDSDEGGGSRSKDKLALRCK